MRTATSLIMCCGLLAACGAQTAPAGNVGAANAAAPANVAEPSNQAAAQGNAASAARHETVNGVFAGWEMGDYLWARIDVPAREPVRAMVEGDAYSLFLEANRGRPVTVEITTGMMNIPEAGGETEIARITAARNAAGTAEAWLAALPAAERRALQTRFEGNALSGNAR